MECRKSMSSKTLRAPPGGVARPSGSGSGIGIGDCSGSKRKERDHNSLRPKSLPTTTPIAPTITKSAKPDKLKSVSKPNKKSSNPMSTKMLLAGYLAHEFLSKGTLLGRHYGQSPNTQKETQQQKYERYVELSLLLKTKEAHISGIMNPAQLANFLKLY